MTVTIVKLANRDYLQITECPNPDGQTKPKIIGNMGPLDLFMEGSNMKDVIEDLKKIAKEHKGKPEQTEQ